MPRNNRRTNLIWFCLGIGLILVLIRTGGLAKGNLLVFPRVKDYSEAFLRLIQEGKTYALISTTLWHVLEALALSVGIGFAIGLAEGFSSGAHAFFQPLMNLIRSLPMIMLVILIMAMLSYKAVPLTAATVVLIPVISEAVYEGCRSIDPELLDVYRLNAGFGWPVVRSVYLPMIAGYVRQAFMNAAGMGLKITVSAEYLVQTRNSLGKAIYSSSYFSEYAEMYAYAFLMVLLVYLISKGPVLLYRVLHRETP